MKTGKMQRTIIPGIGLQVQMGQMWAGLFLWCCFLLVLFNSPSAFCDSMMRKIGPPDNGFQTLNSGKGFRNFEKQNLLKAAEDSLRLGRGIGFVNQLNTMSGSTSARPMNLDSMQTDLGQRRLLEGNVTRSNTTEGRLSAPTMKKKVYVKQRGQKDLTDKSIQNYNVRKEKQGRRSDGAQSLLKPQISQAQQNPNDGTSEKRKKKSAPETEVEFKRNDFRTETKGRKQASTVIYKVEKQAEEEEEEGNINATVPERKVKVDIRDNTEEFESNDLPTKLKGKKKASRFIHKDEKEEEQESLTVTVPEIKETQNAQDREEDSSGNEMKTRMRRKSPISKKNRKGEAAEEENSTTTITAVGEESNAQDRKEESNRSKLQDRMRRKQPVSKTILKDEAEEEDNSVAARPGIQEQNNAQDRKEEFKRKEPQARMRRKQPVSKSIRKDEKQQEEENPNARLPEIKNEKVDQDSEEESSIKESQTPIKGKKPVFKSTPKVEEEEEKNQNATMPENKEKQNAGDSEEESKSNDLQIEVKGAALAPESVHKVEKNVNDDGLELAEEFPSPDQSNFESLNNTKHNDEFRDDKSQGSQELEADQVKLNEAVSDRVTKGVKGKGRDDKRQGSQEQEADQVELNEAVSDRVTKGVKGRGRDDKSQGIQEQEADQIELNEAVSDKVTKRVNGKGRAKGILKQEEINEEEITESEIKDDESRDDQGQETEEIETDELELNEATSDRETKRVSGKSQERGMLKQEETNAEEFTKSEIKDDEFRDDQGQETEEMEADQVEFNEEAISDKETKRMKGKGREKGILKQEETNAEESTESDIKVDEVESTTNSKFSETGEDDAGDSANNDVMDEDESKKVPSSKQSKYNFRKPAKDDADESAKNNREEDAESETVPTDTQSSSVVVEESAVNSTDSVEESEGEYSDFINEIADLPSKFQDTAGKVADRLMPEFQKFSNKSKVYFSRANEGIADGFRPIVGHQYAPYVASVISYIFVLLPLILVIVSFDQIRTYFPLQRLILFANIYLAAYFATLMIASSLIGMEPMLFFFRNSLSGYIYLQLLEALGYILYLLLQCLNLIISFSNGPSSAKLVAFLQSGVSIFIGLHYYVTVFHRAMAQKAPHTSWKIHGAYTIAFFVLCLFSKIKHGKKEYVQEQYSSVTNKKN